MDAKQPTVPEGSTPSSPGQPTCFGRERELEALEALYRTSRDSGLGRIAYLTGQPGLGKDRLVDTFLARLPADVLVLEGRCLPAGAPYGVLADAVAQAVHALDGTPLGGRAEEVLDALRGRAPRRLGASDPSSWERHRAALYEEAANLLSDVTRLRPTVLLLRDLHLADGATRDLFGHFAQTRVPAPELAADGAERFAGLVVVSSRDPDAGWLAGAATTRIELQPLDADGVRAFLQSPEVVAFFAEVTGGRPRALEALLESRPADADDLFRARLRRLSPEGRGLLQALSVLGRPAGGEELRRLAEVPDDRLARAIAEVRQARLCGTVVVDGELRLCFQRSADGEATYAALDELERRGLHLGAARLLAEAPVSSIETSVALAEHLLRGAAGERAVDAALAAADRLELTFAFDRAIDLLRRAHAITARDAVQETIELRLVELLRWVGDYGGALEHAERLRRRAGDAAAHRRVAQLHVLRDELSLALEALDAAGRLAEAAGDPLETARVAAARAETCFLAGRHLEAKAECARALAHEGADAEAQGRILEVRNTLGKVALAEADHVEASRIFESNVELARSLGRPFEESRALYNLGIAQLRLGANHEAQARYQAALKVAEAAGDHRNRAFCLQNLGVLAHWRCDYATSLAYFHEAVSAFRTIGQRARLAWVALDLASVYLDLSEIARAEAMAELASGFCAGSPPKAVAINLLLVRGRVALGRRDLAAAEAHLAASREMAAASANHDRATEASLWLVRADLDRGDAAAAAARLADLPPAVADRTRARRLLLDGEVQVARGCPAEARRRLMEAVELFHRLDAPDGEWRAHYWLGRAAEARGDRTEAQRRFRHAHTIDEQLAARVPEAHRGAWADDPLRVALGRALGLARVVPLARAEARPAPRLVPPAAPGPHPRLIGRHPRLLSVFNLIAKAAPHDSLVLIRGESGTGKELVAEALHAGSARRDRPLVKVNCGALVESLLLSELFGHERGAFTGAVQRKKGHFEVADGGTIFLDEIGDISPKTQVALLRVLQERQFERVGGTQPIKVDVRIICATHRNLEQMVARGEFREDLYYRLKGIQIELPALRERKEDIPELVAHFLARAASERRGEPKSLTDEAMALVTGHSWPGNVRELENVIRSVSLFADGPVIGVQDFADYTEVFRDAAVPPPAPAPAPLDLVADEGDGPAAWARLRAEGLSLKQLKTRVEVECITEALNRAGGNITRAAELLGMKRPRLSQLIKEHGIHLPGGLK